MARERWIGAALAAAATTLVAAGCGSSGDSGSSGKQGSTDSASGQQKCQKGATIGFSMPLPDPNFAVLGPVVKADLEKDGYKVILTQANLDPGKQISDINSLIGRGIKALVTNPVDPRAVQPVIQRLNSMHIPIVVQETRIGGPYTTDVTSTVEDAAADGAVTLKKAVGNRPVTALEGLKQAEILNRENEAFLAKAKEIGLKVVDRKTNVQVTPDGARQQALVWKQRYGSHLKGIWSFNDSSALGMSSLIGNGFAPKIVSINGESEVIPLIKQGKVLATYWLQLPKIAHTLSYAVEQSLCQKPLPKEIFLPLKKITSANISDWKSPEQQSREKFPVKIVQRNGRATVAGF